MPELNKYSCLEALAAGYSEGESNQRELQQTEKHKFIASQNCSSLLLGGRRKRGECCLSLRVVWQQKHSLTLWVFWAGLVCLAVSSCC